jgi:hypothetical protein
MEKMQIGCGRCRDPTLALVYGLSRFEYCIIVSPLVVFESMAKKILFCPSARTRCYGESMGIDCFYPIKNVSLKVGRTPTSLAMEWGCMDSNHMEGFNNLGLRRVHLLFRDMPQQPPLKMSQLSLNLMERVFLTIVMTTLMAIIVLQCSMGNLRTLGRNG